MSTISKKKQRETLARFGLPDELKGRTIRFTPDRAYPSKLLKKSLSARIRDVKIQPGNPDKDIPAFVDIYLTGIKGHISLMLFPGEKEPRPPCYWTRNCDRFHPGKLKIG